jgi:hypothetical protein
MASKDSLDIRKLQARGVIGYVNNDADIALRLKYVGTGSVTSVTVTTATDITMVTSDGGTDAYTWSAYTTLGALADKINADGIFEAKILDGLRADSTATSIFIDGAITASVNESNETVWDMKWDTSGAARLTYRLTYDRTFGKDAKLKDGHRVTLMQIKTSLTCGGGADANALKIYECAPAHRGSTETLISQRTPTTGSAETITWASGEVGITAKDGNDLVIKVTDGTSLAATDFIEIVGVVE